MSLRRASDAEKVERDHLAAEAWGQALDRPQFLERERVLRAHPWARSGMETWVWAEGNRLLASCETFRSRARRGPYHGDVYSIASVITEPALRRRGYASAMLEVLLQNLRARPGALGAALFSEVGPSLYARLGFETAPDSEDLVYPADVEEWPYGVSKVHAPLPPVPEPPADEGLVLWPTAEQLDWHLERSRFYARALVRPMGKVLGARMGEACLWWQPYFKSRELLVLWTQAATPHETKPLLDAARFTARTLGFRQVRAWAVPTLDATGAQRVPRDDELPMSMTFHGPAVWRNVQRALWV